MNFVVTKTWKALNFNKATINIPSIPGLEIAASDAEPTNGIRYSGQIKSFYTDTKLWIRIPQEAKIKTIEVNVQNFI